MKTKSPLAYFGSDASVAPQLGAMLDHCRHVTIPFCGGLSILPHLNARAIVANDLHELAVNFYRVVSGRFGDHDKQQLLSACNRTLSHPTELGEARLIIARRSGSEARLAWAYWALTWIGRKGKGGTKHQGDMPSIRRTATGGTNASRIRAAASDLEGWAKQFERCEFECDCFRNQLPKVADRDDCGIYCDPPWVGAGRNYLHSFDEQDHRDLAELLQRFEHTTVVIRYGNDPLIRELYDGWHITEASSRTQSNSSVGEIWITNKPTHGETQ
ncbi:MAG: DNA adenine methylase [Planctomycetota bacterium]